MNDDTERENTKGHQWTESGPTTRVYHRNPPLPKNYQRIWESPMKKHWIHCCRPESPTWICFQAWDRYFQHSGFMVGSSLPGSCSFFSNCLKQKENHWKRSNRSYSERISLNQLFMWWDRIIIYSVLRSLWSVFHPVIIFRPVESFRLNPKVLIPSSMAVRFSFTPLGTKTDAWPNLQISEEDGYRCGSLTGRRICGRINNVAFVNYVCNYEITIFEEYAWSNNFLNWKILISIFQGCRHICFGMWMRTN